MKKILVSVVGGHECNDETAKLAEDVGRVIAKEECVLVSGGLTGVMEASCKGAKKEGGLTIGILPGRDKDDANDFVDVAITTGMWYARNVIIAAGSDIVVAFPGEYGTLSEIGFALSQKKKVYGFGTWDIPDVIKLNSPKDLREVLRHKK